MQRRFITEVDDSLAEMVFGANVAQTYNRRQIMKFQFVKLLNYFADDLVPEWGGSYIDSEIVIAPKALERFLEYTAGEDEAPWWIDKRYDNQPWGPTNVRFVQQPPKEMGAPYEAYLSLDGAICTINQASRMLCVDSATLVGLKLKLLYDELVVLECLKRMLRPRAEWPKITARQGGNARTFRFSK